MAALLWTLKTSQMKPEKLIKNTADKIIFEFTQLRVYEGLQNTFKIWVRGFRKHHELIFGVMDRLLL